MNNLDLQIEEAKERFLEWLDYRAEQELFKLNFWFHYNHNGIIFTDHRGYEPVGIPVIFGTGGEIEKGNYKEIWINPSGYKLKDSFNYTSNVLKRVTGNQYIDIFKGEYYIGTDPY